ncbi:hypothetical protein ACS3SW_02755 [Roseobacteraceae bacterium S113]
MSDTGPTSGPHLQNNVISLPVTSKTQAEAPQADQTISQVWPDALRLYLREQITSAQDAHERAAAVRLASALATRAS